MDVLASGMIVAVAAAFMAAGVWSGKGYEAFQRGARDGLQTGLQMLPALTAMLLLIGVINTGGLAELLEGCLGPVVERLGVPQEALTALLLRPLSGAGSLAALQELMTRMGPDSRAARVAAVVVGSSETIFYTMTVYLAAAGVKKLPHALGISLLSWLAGVAAACCICR